MGMRWRGDELQRREVEKGEGGGRAPRCFFTGKAKRHQGIFIRRRRLWLWARVCKAGRGLAEVTQQGAEWERATCRRKETIPF
jgi:hypothetical protein